MRRDGTSLKCTLAKPLRHIPFHCLLLIIINIIIQIDWNQFDQKCVLCWTYKWQRPNLQILQAHCKINPANYLLPSHNYNNFHQIQYLQIILG